MFIKHTGSAALALCLLMTLSSCTAARVAGKAVTLPVKAAYHTVRLTGTGVVAAGRGLYYVGRVPVKISAAALSTAATTLA